MEIAAQGLLAFIAIQHLGFLALEMFLWDKPIGMKVFRTDLEFARKSKSLAMNQGLYNGFLSAGLFWALMADHPLNVQLALFFTACVFVAGVFGALTVSRTILYVQAVPALIAFALNWMRL